MRGVFVSDRPTRRFRRETKFVLQADFVDFDDDAVDFKRQFLALRFPLVDVFLDFFDRMMKLPILADFEMQLTERLEKKWAFK